MWRSRVGAGHQHGLDTEDTDQEGEQRLHCTEEVVHNQVMEVDAAGPCILTFLDSLVSLQPWALTWPQSR